MSFDAAMDGSISCLFTSWSNASRNESVVFHVNWPFSLCRKHHCRMIITGTFGKEQTEPIPTKCLLRWRRLETKQREGPAKSFPTDRSPNEKAHISRFCQSFCIPVTSAASIQDLRMHLSALLKRRGWVTKRLKWRLWAGICPFHVMVRIRYANHGNGAQGEAMFWNRWSVHDAAVSAQVFVGT